MIRRILALIIDFTIFVIFFGFINPKIIELIAFIIHGSLNETTIAIIIWVNLISFFMIFVFSEIMFFASPGKWMFNLEIKSYNNERPKRVILLFRSIIKLFSLLSFIGIPINLLLFYLNKFVWYDYLLGLDIVHKNPIKLSKTQKEWRKHFKNE